MNMAVVAQKANAYWDKTVLRKVIYMPAVKSAGSSNANPRLEYPEDKRFEVKADIKDDSDENENRERGTSLKTVFSCAIRKSDFAEVAPKPADRILYGSQVFKILKISLDEALRGFELYFFEAENAD